MTYTPEQLLDLLRKVYSGKYTPRALPEDLYLALIGLLSDGVVSGFGVDDAFDDVAGMIRSLDRNVAIFSAAKTFQQVLDMSASMFDADGVKVSFESFKLAASNIFEQYNVNWLKTEYRTAFNNAAAARQWMSFDEDRELFPYLRYDTAGDERVRKEHTELDGLVAHIDHPIWNTHFPPNGWNCRCDVTAHEAEDVTPTDDSVLNSMSPDNELFAFNPGKDKKVFDTDNHPYMKVEDRYTTHRDNNFGLPLPAEK